MSDTESGGPAAWWATSDKACHMVISHGRHLWDTEDRVRLRYACRGVTPPASTDYQDPKEPS